MAVNYNKGFIFLEILIAVTLISIVFVYLLGIGFTSLNISSSLAKENQANFLIKEEMEALRAFRDATKTTWGTTGIGSYSVDTNYYMALSGTPSSWTIASGTETTGNFTRKMYFSRVSRDGSGNIVSSGGTDDPDTRRVTVEVLFDGASRQAITYLTNWQKE